MATRFQSLTLTPKDVAFAMFDQRELTGTTEVTIFDEIESAFAVVLRFLSF